MIRNDYILRLIEMFGVFAQRVARRFDDGEFQAVEGDLDEISRRFTGISFSLLREMEAGQIAGMLSVGDGLETGKLYIIGSLFQEEARLAALEGNEVRAFHSRLKALELLLPTCRESGLDSTLRPLVVERTDVLAAEISDYELPEEIGLELLKYYEREGRFAHAEDFLYRHLKDAETFRNIAKEFYQRLRVQPDAALEQGNLSREEIEEALRELES